MVQSGFSFQGRRERGGSRGEEGGTLGMEGGGNDSIDSIETKAKLDCSNWFVV